MAVIKPLTCTDPNNLFSKKAKAFSFFWEERREFRFAFSSCSKCFLFYYYSCCPSSSTCTSCAFQNCTTAACNSTLSTEYSSTGGAHAYMARVVSVHLGDRLPQGVVSNPVQLTVANNTKILLNATRPNPSSTIHYFVGRVIWNDTAVRDRPVNVTINQTCYYRGLTNESGHFCFSVDLKPVENRATSFVVLACFEDNVTQAVNVTAWAKTPDGQDYAACTTVQFGYKPASKSISLTVKLEKTDVVDPDKTPEELQKQTQKNGWFTSSP